MTDETENDDDIEIDDEWLREWTKKQRLRCKNCGEQLKRETYGDGVSYGYQGNGHFCSLQCGFHYAIESLK